MELLLSWILKIRRSSNRQIGKVYSPYLYLTSPTTFIPNLVCIHCYCREKTRIKFRQARRRVNWHTPWTPHLSPPAPGLQPWRSGQVVSWRHFIHQMNRTVSATAFLWTSTREPNKTSTQHTPARKSKPHVILFFFNYQTTCLITGNLTCPNFI